MGVTVGAFVVLVALLIIERLAELRSAKRNFAKLLSEGGIEFGRGHYIVIVSMHVAFFLSLILEFALRSAAMPSWWFIPATTLVIGQLLRLWGRRTMEGRWTTRVIVVPGESLIRRGPYALVPHPIYVAVAFEIASVPLIFGLFVTAILFSALNAIVLLGLRIPVERRALAWSQGKEFGGVLVERHD